MLEIEYVSIDVLVESGLAQQNQNTYKFQT
jgi:hypothetical protein